MLYAFLISRTCYIPRPSHPPSFVNVVLHIWWTQITKALIILPLKSKYSPHSPILKHLNLCACPNVEDQISDPHEEVSEVTIL
jgi:hypothetical protein